MGSPYHRRELWLSGTLVWGRIALLGMNVITDCWEELFQARPIRTAPPAEKREWERIVADCRRVHTATSQGDREGTGRVACRYALSIPARSEAVIWARLPAQTYGPEDWVLVEPHLDCQIVEVARGLAVARRGRVAVSTECKSLPRSPVPPSTTGPSYLGEPRTSEARWGSQLLPSEPYGG